MSPSPWIEVDRAGLAQLIEDRPRSFLLFELIQNAIDEDGVTRVDVKIEHEAHGRHRITVTDDSPDGYADIRHAWTMFAPSKKKGDPSKRGRFNLGCKLVLALAVDATIVSTCSAVVFSTEHGRRSLRRRRERGTEFSGLFRMSQADVAAALADVERMLPPKGVAITVDAPDGGAGRRVLELRHRDPVVEFRSALPTVFADADGVLRRTTRIAAIELHERPQDGPSILYEMGIPVVELDGDDPWSVDVQQRVPLNTDRDNVAPAFLRALRVAVLNAAHSRLTSEQAKAVWATEASEDDRADSEAVAKVIDERFGKKRVAYDPSDPEANARAVAAGYTVVHGGSMTKGQWDNARRAGAIQPAGQVTPSQKVRTAPDGVPPLDEDQLSPVEREVSAVARMLAARLDVCGDLSVAWYIGRSWPWAGAWGRGGSLSLNRAKLRTEIAAWARGDMRPMVRLLIHEFAHERVENHLSDAFADECIRLAVELAFSPPWEAAR